MSNWPYVLFDLLNVITREVAVLHDVVEDLGVTVVGRAPADLQRVALDR